VSRWWPGHAAAFRGGQWRQRVRAPGRRPLPPSADTAFKDVAYDATIEATQTFNNGQYGHSMIATRGPGTEAKAAVESKIAGYRAALADVQPLTNRRTKFVVLAVESSEWTDPTVQRLVNVWGQQASRRLGPDRRWSPAGFSTRHELSSEIQYWNSVGAALWVSKSPYWMMGGRPLSLNRVRRS
jgi:hypothetical protein